jgi:hypothetical protein
MVLAQGSPSRPALLVVKHSLLQKIDALPHDSAALGDSAEIFFERYPLSGTFPSFAFDTAARKIETLFARHVRVRELRLRNLDTDLPAAALSGRGTRYFFAPCGITAIAHEKKQEVGSFVKLNREGDFVPTNTTRVVGSRSTDVIVRFVLVDLAARTVVFDDREKVTVSDDEAVRGTLPKDESPGTPAGDQVATGVMRIAAKVAVKLRKRFWK